MSMFTTILGQMSGGNIAEAQSQLIFNKVIGIRGVVDGVGCSTFVQGLAHAFSTQTRLSICVVDTNILYPSQYAYLGVSLAEQADNNDWLTQGQPVSRLVMDTKFKRVYQIKMYKISLLYRNPCFRIYINESCT